MNTKKIEDLDARLFVATTGIRVLKALTWPQESESVFLEQWHKGNPVLPTFKPPVKDLSANIYTLEKIAHECQQDEPIEKFLAETAQSYANAGKMLMHVGTPDFTRYSEKIYGRPDHIYKLQGLSAVDAAKSFLQTTDSLLGNYHVPETTTDIPAEKFAEWMKTEVNEFFDQDVVEVKLDARLTSKAIAGASRIRIRSNAQFSQLDKDQLLYHEAFVHTATMLNGKKQTNLKSLSLGAPRTTRTQEGIAVVSELITNAMDITRLRRIALRVLAVKQALDGADFIDLFKFFLEAGQSEEESVRSAQRIFRGGDVKNGVVFTKDGVYLQGLLEVHTFMRIAIRDNRPELINNLFAGRLTLTDTLRLAPLFESGWLRQPVYVPIWAADLRRLSAMMAYSAFISNIRLDKVYLNRFVEMEDEITQG
ncbi:MAG: DUF1704 domain-containing protein [Cyclobacteriaceae bacterium]|nr:DUF1704 domain-containing protein [Cyclobacteriaceae bacterium]